jgi:hypothetical protein
VVEFVPERYVYDCIRTAESRLYVRYGQALQRSHHRRSQETRQHPRRHFQSCNTFDNSQQQLLVLYFATASSWEDHYHAQRPLQEAQSCVGCQPSMQQLYRYMQSLYLHISFLTRPTSLRSLLEIETQVQPEIPKLIDIVHLDLD